VINASHLIILVTKAKDYFTKDNKEYMDKIAANTTYNRAQFGAETTQEHIDASVNVMLTSDHANNGNNYEE
jgi:hypothetical protein